MVERKACWSLWWWELVARTPLILAGQEPESKLKAEETVNFKLLPYHSPILQLGSTTSNDSTMS